MSPRGSDWVLLLACVAIGCGGRSTLEDAFGSNGSGNEWHTTSSGGAVASSGSNKTAGSNAAGGTPAEYGGARATGGSSAGTGGNRTIGKGGGATAIGGALNAKGGATSAAGAFPGTGGARATGGTASANQGGTIAGTGASSGQGGVSTGYAGSSSQGGAGASAGNGGLSGGVTATGGVPNATASSGGTDPTDTSDNCLPYRVWCGSGASAKCVDLSTDPEHCGQCGHTCPKGAACSDGECELARCSPSFKVGGIPTVEADRSAYVLATGDFNRDGYADLATANPEANTVSTLLGDGRGGFRRRTDYPIGSEPRAIATGDFNLDGKLDLVTATYGSNSVTVLFGVGDGSFGSAVQYPVGQGPTGIAVADLDGDHTEDIATVNWTAGTVSVLLGSGQGSLAASVDYPAGLGPSRIVTADVNGDGITDLVTNGGSQNVLLGVGGGKFMAASVAPLEADDALRGHLALGDLNSDGKQDVVVASPNGRRTTGTFGVRFGGGDGSFSPMLEYEPGASRVVALVDLDKDGKVELIASVGGHFLSIFTLDANGSLAGEVRYPTPAPTDALVIGDFNGDAWLDIATLDRWGIYVLMGTGQGKFDSPHTQPAGASLNRIVLHDLNGDGDLDIAATAHDTDAIIIQLGRGDGTFAGAIEYQTGYAQALFEIGDLDGDGDLDLVSANKSELGVSVLWNAGNASFSSRTDYPTAAGVDFLALGDADNDGLLDILAFSTAVSTSDSSGASVLLNSGAGVFVSAPHSTNVAPWSQLAIGDLNHDGNLDIVQANSEQYWVAVRLGLGGGRFSLALHSPTYGMNTSSHSIALGDLNQDGNLDLVLSRHATLAVMIGAGDGTFTALAPQLVAGSYDLDHLALGDLNGDGVLDLVSSGLVSWVGYEIVAMLGAGDGSFTCATASLAAGTDNASFALADVDGDQRLDIVVPHHATQSINVLLNQPN